MVDGFVMQTSVVSAFPGTGKTYLCNHTRRVLTEKECWLYDKSKFPENYVTAIKEELGSVDAVFISTNKQVLDILISEQIEITLIYPTVDQKERYMNRYQKRGSHIDFINAMDKYWAIWIKELDERNDCLKHILHPGQFIADVIPGMLKSCPLLLAGTVSAGVRLPGWHELTKKGDKMTSQQNPEPWAVSEGDPRYVRPGGIEDAYGYRVAEAWGHDYKEIASRIVACVNACKGISTKELEELGTGAIGRACQTGKEIEAVITKG